MDEPRLVLLGREGEGTSALYHALHAEFAFAYVVLEPSQARRALLLRRARRLGWPVVIGQALFQGLLHPLLRRRSRDRRAKLLRTHGLSQAGLPEDIVLRVASINQPSVVELLREVAPAAVVVSGTRILSPELLAAIDAPFVNLHTGVTPGYRGVHGGYWALVNGDRAHCGVTVHLVDRGVDTGPILAWAPIAPTARDDITTYPLLQLAVGLPLLREALRRAILGTLSVSSAPPIPSRIWSHPTIWGYLWRRLVRGVG